MYKYNVLLLSCLIMIMSLSMAGATPLASSKRNHRAFKQEINNDRLTHRQVTLYQLNEEIRVLRNKNLLLSSKLRADDAVIDKLKPNTVWDIYLPVVIGALLSALVAWGIFVKQTNDAKKQVAAMIERIENTTSRQSAEISNLLKNGFKSLLEFISLEILPKENPNHQYIEQNKKLERYASILDDLGKSMGNDFLEQVFSLDPKSRETWDAIQTALGKS